MNPLSGVKSPRAIDRSFIWVMTVGLLISSTWVEPGSARAGEPLMNPSTTTGSTSDSLSQKPPVEKGRSLFRRNCAHCHGDDGRGDEGPSLYDLIRTDLRIKEIIREGIKGEMPRFGAKLSEAEIAAVIAYLRTLQS